MTKPYLTSNLSFLSMLRSGQLDKCLYSRLFAALRQIGKTKSTSSPCSGHQPTALGIVMSVQNYRQTQSHVICARRISPMLANILNGCERTIVPAIAEPFGRIKRAQGVC